MNLLSVLLLSILSAVCLGMTLPASHDPQQATLNQVIEAVREMSPSQLQKPREIDIWIGVVENILAEVGQQQTFLENTSEILNNTGLVTVFLLKMGQTYAQAREIGRGISLFTDKEFDQRSKNFLEQNPSILDSTQRVFHLFDLLKQVQTEVMTFAAQRQEQMKKTYTTHDQTEYITAESLQLFIQDCIIILIPTTEFSEWRSTLQYLQAKMDKFHAMLVAGVNYETSKIQNKLE